MAFVEKEDTQIDYFVDDFKMDPLLWRQDISQQDALLFFESARLKASLQPDYPAVLKFKQRKSMLHPDVLILLRALASVMSGPIVEFGTYIGGSTTMIAKGLQPDSRFLAVEVGGCYDNHPHLPTSDIFTDLENNLIEQGVWERVKLVKDNARTSATRKKIEDFLDGERISMLAIDADGNVDADLEMYQDLCAPGCMLVIDDYIDCGWDEGSGKAVRTKKCVDACVESGRFVQFGVMGWATWFGRLA